MNKKSSKTLHSTKLSKYHVYKYHEEKYRPDKISKGKNIHVKYANY